MQPSFAELLGQFLHRAQSSANRVAKLSGVPKQTISNWLLGRVIEPYYWQPILKVALALHLSESEINQLLKSAGHPALDELRTIAKAEVDHLIPTATPATLVSTASPFQVIPDLPTFVGRQFEIQAVKTLLVKGQSVAICSFRGMGGVGKTTLAAHLAYQLRTHFVDGVLWARVDAADSMSILGSFASALGHDVSHLRDLESRSASVRSILATKQVLLILDNATSSEQVRHLLPPTPGPSAAIITTRNDLLINDATHRFEITPFDPERGESLALFERFLGTEFVVHHLDLLVKIAERLGHLPLAVSIAAGKISHYFHEDIEAFWDELQRADVALGALEREDRSVRLSFDLSYNQLTPELQRFFDTLGVFGGEDFSVEAVAYVSGVELEIAQTQLRMLCNYSLVQPSQKRRYRLHPLLREYASEHLSVDMQKDDDCPSLRMLTYYASFAEEHSRDHTDLELELSNFLFAHDAALQQNALDPFLRQAIALFPFLELLGLYDIADSQMHIAHQVATQRENTHDCATTLLYCGVIQMRRSNYSYSLEIYQNALQIARHTDDMLLIARIEEYISSSYFSIGNYSDGEGYARSAFAIAEKISNVLVS